MYKPEYNILTIANSSKGFLHTTNSIKKRQASKGRVHTPEVKLAMSKNRMGPLNPFFGKKHSFEVIQLLREIALTRNFLPRKGYPYTVLDTQSNISTSYSSIRSAAKGINV